MERYEFDAKPNDQKFVILAKLDSSLIQKLEQNYLEQKEQKLKIRFDQAKNVFSVDDKEYTFRSDEEGNHHELYSYNYADPNNLWQRAGLVQRKLLFDLHEISVEEREQLKRKTEKAEKARKEKHKISVIDPSQEPIKGRRSSTKIITTTKPPTKLSKSAVIPKKTSALKKELIASAAPVSTLSKSSSLLSSSSVKPVPPQNTTTTPTTNHNNTNHNNFHTPIHSEKVSPGSSSSSEESGKKSSPPAPSSTLQSMLPTGNITPLTKKPLGKNDTHLSPPDSSTGNNLQQSPTTANPSSPEEPTQVSGNVAPRSSTAAATTTTATPRPTREPAQWEKSAKTFSSLRGAELRKCLIQVLALRPLSNNKLGSVFGVDAFGVLRSVANFQAPSNWALKKECFAEVDIDWKNYSPTERQTVEAKIPKNSKPKDGPALEELSSGTSGEEKNSEEEKEAKGTTVSHQNTVVTITNPKKPARQQEAVQQTSANSKSSEKELTSSKSTTNGPQPERARGKTRPREKEKEKVKEKGRKEKENDKKRKHESDNGRVSSKALEPLTNNDPELNHVVQNHKVQRTDLSQASPNDMAVPEHPPITTWENFVQKRSEYDLKYQEYISLRSEFESIRKTFAHIGERWKDAQSSKEKTQLDKKIVSLYTENAEKVETLRKRHSLLHQELKLLKQRLEEAKSNKVLMQT